MNKRLKEINLLLSEYSVGRFDKRLALSEKLDETDAVVNGINMLGEELKAITISRDYFTNIFNSVSDMVFILNSNGFIADVNHAAEKQLGYQPGNLQGKAFDLLHRSASSLFNIIKRQLKDKNAVIIRDGYLDTEEGAHLPVRIHASYFNDAPRSKMILLTASDTSFQVQAEKMILRAIIDTQEKERQRLAKDLHDSLTQQLSAIKFYIGSLSSRYKGKEERLILQKSNEGLTEVISDMRNICFNLMPRTLEEFGLVKAVREFCAHYPHTQKTQFVIRQHKSLPALPAELAVDLYRVTQEIISNALRHGRARIIRLSFSFKNNAVMVLIADDGCGFDPGKSRSGMGLKNVQSRVRSHNGKLYLQSNTGKGTSCRILIPFIV